MRAAIQDHRQCQQAEHPDRNGLDRAEKLYDTVDNAHQPDARVQRHHPIRPGDFPTEYFITPEMAQQKV